MGFNVPGSPGRSPGPTLRVRAGDKLKILLKNNMRCRSSGAEAVLKQHRIVDEERLP